MFDMIKVEINGEEADSIGATELHERLEVKTPIHKWIQRRIEASNMIEGIDYLVLDRFVQNPQGGRPGKEYRLTQDAAKHIAMMEGTQKGQEVRCYFIEVEKRARMAQKAMEDITKAKATQILKADLEIAALLKVPEHLAQTEAVKEVKRLTGLDYSNLLALSTTQDNIKEEDKMLEPTELGKLVGISANKVNKFLCRKGLQNKTKGGWIATEKGKQHSTSHHWTRGGKSGYNYKWSLLYFRELWEKTA